MNISPVMAYLPKRQLSVKNNVKNNISFKATAQDFSTGSFHIAKVADQKKLNILGCSDEHIRHLGEVLRTTPNDLIYSKFSRQDNIFGNYSELKTQKAYVRLLPYVIEARERYDKNEAEIALIESQDPQNDYTRQRAKICKEERARMDQVASTAMDYTREIELDFSDLKPAEESYDDKLYGAR